MTTAMHPDCWDHHAVAGIAERVFATNAPYARLRWTVEDEVRALKQGWEFAKKTSIVRATSTPAGFDLPVFSSDEQAVRFVQERASQGDGHALKAWRIHEFERLYPRRTPGEVLHDQAYAELLLQLGLTTASGSAGPTTEQLAHTQPPSADANGDAQRSPRASNNQEQSA